MLLAALPQDAVAEWVEPEPGTLEDDEFWHVTYDFIPWWEEEFPGYQTGTSNREPNIATFQDKLWLVWEGLLLPRNQNEGTSYKGKIYARSYYDLDGEPQWGRIIDMTPNANWSDHTNQKAFLIPFKGKLYLFWMSNDQNQKPAGADPFQFDILMKTYDGNPSEKWTDTEVISRAGAFSTGGMDKEPKATVFKDRLYLTWSREDLEAGIMNVLYRSFDGSSWGGIGVLNEYPNENMIHDYPYFEVYKDRLYCMWQSRVVRGDMQTVYSFTTDGNTWTPVKPLSRKISLKKVSLDAMPIMRTYVNPKTSDTELHAVWRTYDVEATLGSDYDYDLVTRVTTDGDNWSPTRELSSTEDEFDDTHTEMIVFNDKLYIFWASADVIIKDGNDHDIMLVTYDGETYSDFQLISRSGDRDKPLWDDNEFWNYGTDHWPKAAIYPNKWGDERLFVIWWTFDHITGCCADEPEEAHGTVVLKMVEDTDHDGDGVMDRFDACDDDKYDHIDTDGDGCCDSNDVKPNDPTVCTEEEVEPGEKIDWMYLAIILIIILVVAVALMASGGKKKPAPPKEAPKKKGTKKSTKKGGKKKK